MLILGERHLYRLIGEYVTYFNHARPHQGIDQRIPVPRESDTYRMREIDQRMVGHPVLGACITIIAGLLDRLISD
jgi:hypothetical protein